MIQFLSILSLNSKLSKSKFLRHCACFIFHAHNPRFFGAKSIYVLFKKSPIVKKEINHKNAFFWIDCLLLQIIHTTNNKLFKMSIYCHIYTVNSKPYVFFLVYSTNDIQNDILKIK